MSSTTEPLPGHSAIRSSASPIASKNSAPRRGRCSSNQTAAASTSSSASTENSIGRVTERALSEPAHGPRATGGPDPLPTPHVGPAVRARPPTPLGPRPGHRAHPDPGWPGDQRRTQRGDRPEASTHRVGESPGRSPSRTRVLLATRHGRGTHPCRDLPRRGHTAMFATRPEAPISYARVPSRSVDRSER